MGISPPAERRRSDGKVGVYTKAGADILIDVNGYFD